jgi:hypothetical protein
MLKLAYFVFMFQFILGVLLLLIPFLLLFNFKDKIVGFSYILSGSFLFHLVVALFTQVTHIFYYPVILILNLVFSAICFFFFIKSVRKNTFDRKKISLSLFSLSSNIKNNKKINWLFISSFIIILFQFVSIHFNYTGLVSTVNGPVFERNYVYPYPYFSDEWISLYVVDTTISENRLPISNVFFDKKDLNYFVGFHGFLAEVTLLLNLNLLYHYSVLAIVFGVLATVLIYLILRSLNVSNFLSVITMLLVPLVTNASNLPGLWYLLPWNLGFIVFLLTIIFMVKEKTIIALISSVLATAFYPALFVFTVPSTIIYLLINKKKNLKILYFYILSLTSFVLIFIFVASIFTENSFLSMVKKVGEMVYRPYQSSINLTPIFPIWYVVPVVAIPFAFMALWHFRKKLPHILFPVVFGLVLWVIYFFHNISFAVDVHRTVAITSLLLMIFAGLGFQLCWEYLQKTDLSSLIKKNKKIIKIIKIIKVLSILFFLLISFSYTARENWQYFKNKLPYGGDITFIKSAPPANEYLNENDLRIFENLHNEKFISPRWKGLVLGYVTDNLPMYTKASTFSIETVNYGDFTKYSCEEKTKVVKKHNISYVYSEPFLCEGFSVVNRNEEENLSLYKYKVD